MRIGIRYDNCTAGLSLLALPVSLINAARSHRDSRLLRFALCLVFLPLCTAWTLADSGLRFNSSPLAPEYRIHEDGSVTLRICFNWSCARTQIMTFTAEEMSGVAAQMAVCSGTAQRDRLQRVRIAMWQLELLAQKYQPALANDQSINAQEVGVEGRMDCVDNASNTTTYLRILEDLGALPGWIVSSPRVRMATSINRAHWTAVVIDAASAQRWSVDSWYRENGHLPFVVPLDDWLFESLGWEPPHDQINPYPLQSRELCADMVVTTVH